MSNFLLSVKRLILAHGLSLNIASVSASAYNVETGTSTPTKTNYTKTMFPKQIIATHYNYPTLVGKETVLFYLSNDSLGFVPKINDEITYKSKVYKVNSLYEYVANGSIVMYELLGAR